MEANTVIQNVISGISRALAEEFGETFTIYAEDVEQFLSLPCFLLLPIDVSERRGLENRFLRSHTITITFLPEDDSLMGLYPVSERLDACLETIPVDDGLVRASNSSSEVSDGALVYTVDYTFRVIRQMDPVEPMELLNYSNKIEEKKGR